MMFESIFIKNAYANANITMLEEPMKVVKEIFKDDNEMQKILEDSLNDFVLFDNMDTTDNYLMVKCLLSSADLDSKDLTKGFTCKIGDKLYIAKLETLGYNWEYIPLSFIESIGSSGGLITFFNIKAVNMKDPTDLCFIDLKLKVTFSSEENLKRAFRKVGIEEEKDESDTTIFLYYPNQDNPKMITCNLKDCCVDDNQLLITYENEIHRYVGIPFEMVSKRVKVKEGEQ